MSGQLFSEIALCVANVVIAAQHPVTRIGRLSDPPPVLPSGFDTRATNMSAQDYYHGGQPQQGGYYPPQGGPPQQGGYYPQQPQQAYQQGYNAPYQGGPPPQGYPQPGYQGQPQTVYVQQPPEKSGGMASGGCMACLAGMCLCCCAEGFLSPFWILATLFMKFACTD
ncbi:uncharacterized protein LACBIDRAFT_294804 [Laccaria bicolor S238N-H82]|uniref:Predicted protein n=1 Tax=Laccaria bicolor (strain S238N-H82 / ATCC MYA-4686) TaxID=486041 RepID=B0DIB4_LACBS|nr:uncharacterized protein LACBIDRAFT_294804 [Laccaria bicolor S238N-H82]EDR05657.1 predicted protein [Laccaria bicolor S238N-H82]|eukprot:XP_001883761.1 predicted protein [Laccaria bicolor S238N-H82]